MKSNTKVALIAEVFIDDSRKLCVRPEAPHEFTHVYRAAMEVYWDRERNCLYSPVPREWTYIMWYEQIVAAVLDEYGFRLIPNQETKCYNLPSDVERRVHEEIPKA